MEKKLTRIERRERQKVIAEEIRNGATVESLSEKYGLSTFGIKTACQVNGVSPSGRWERQKDTRYKAMSLDDLVTWIKSQCERTENGCILWHGSKREGYGDISIGNRHKSIHRLLYEYHYKVKLTSKDFLCHKCDVRNCVNVEGHIFLGTQADNMRDMSEKGRAARGEKSTKAKLKTEDVVEIKKMLRDGFSLRYLGKKFGVDKSAIQWIKKGKNWKHITI